MIQEKQNNESNDQDKKDEKIETEGIVEEALPSTTFKVRIADGSEILAHLSGKMRLHYIRVMPGDKVIVEISPYDKTKGRIIRRLK